MSSYAVMGATGSTGRSLMEILLQTPGAQIHAYCRSKAKLSKLFPGIEQNKDVQIFEGKLDDISLIASCLSRARAAFLTVAETENRPGCCIAINTAKAIINALKSLKAENQELPKLVILSSSSTERRLVPQIPDFFENILYRAFSNIYGDLQEAEQFLRSHADLVSSSFIKPSALSHDARKGHSVSLENSRGPLSFLDLAAGMVEVADNDDGTYDMKTVTVNPTTKNVAFPWEAPGLITRGLIFHFCPWAFRWFGFE